MHLLRSINSAVVDLYHVLFDPVGDGEDRDTITDQPYWVRSVIGWLTIAGMLFLITLWS